MMHIILRSVAVKRLGEASKHYYDPLVVTHFYLP